MAIEAKVLSSYQEIDEAYIDTLLKEEIRTNHQKIVVLDDDPTGVQTVHDISVFTNWEKSSIRQGFDEENKLFYILTNSRGFTKAQTMKAHQEIAAVVDEAAIVGAGLVKNTRDGIKILGRGELTKRLTVKVAAFSEGAKSKIEAAGGKAEVV